jgi:hypothetical protein
MTTDAELKDQEPHSKSHETAEVAVSIVPPSNPKENGDDLQTLIKEVRGQEELPNPAAATAGKPFSDMHGSDNGEDRSFPVETKPDFISAGVTIENSGRKMPSRAKRLSQLRSTS